MKTTQTPATLPDLECACASVRRTSRLITQLYAQEMGERIEPTQFALLTALKSHPCCGQKILGQALALDKTTLSRNLSLMQRNGWITPSPAEDQRERGFVLSATGRKLLASTKPGWTRAQRRLRKAMTEAEWTLVNQAFAIAARAALRAVEENPGPLNSLVG